MIESAKPILFSAEMAKAVLDGRKTQMRRVCVDIISLEDGNEAMLRHDTKIGRLQKGDILGVREADRVSSLTVAYDEIGCEAHMYCRYLAEDKLNVIKVPDMVNDNNHLPEWIEKKKGIPGGCIKEMARTFLKITDVRVELLQDISLKDIFKEGFNGKISDFFTTDNCSYDNVQDVLGWFVSLWDKTATEGYKWEDNPYVFVYEFEKIDLNNRSNK